MCMRREIEQKQSGTRIIIEHKSSVDAFNYAVAMHAANEYQRKNYKLPTDYGTLYGMKVITSDQMKNGKFFIGVDLGIS